MQQKKNFEDNVSQDIRRMFGGPIPNSTLYQNRMIVKKRCSTPRCGKVARSRGLCSACRGKLRRGWKSSGPRKQMLCKSCKAPRNFSSRMAFCDPCRKRYMREKLTAYRTAYPDRIKAYRKKYFETHREDNRAQCRANYQKNKEARLAYQKNYERTKRAKRA